ncbi:DUF5134 domain-containing protein [Actinacidiphila acidipaludis]|uniref:DUF5134 domain-containing protein n=1 Tax=Actinacidiphila acidipaludis TaxID=2873382 RepID=A0ABS7PYV9_9ACTN|nr:DUF5134 domain-containing protein [Streptomyces acidipaludis]MBY8876080.1 DUF5134 domain-containing protein [Streptomyces acidipaludis]
MSAVDAVRLMLTALFAVAAVATLRRHVVRSGLRWRGRTGSLLHAVMAADMACMTWRWYPHVPAMPHTVFYAVAALWFPLSAPRRGDGAVAPEVLRALPSAAAMAAMAWMAHPMRASGHATMAAGLAEGRGTARAMDDSMAASGGGTAAVGLLALFLLLCALWSLTRDLPGLSRTAATGHTSTQSVHDHFWDGVTALGTAVMLVLHH